MPTTPRGSIPLTDFYSLPRRRVQELNCGGLYLRIPFRPFFPGFRFSVCTMVLTSFVFVSFFSQLAYCRPGYLFLPLCFDDQPVEDSLCRVGGREAKAETVRDVPRLSGKLSAGRQRLDTAPRAGGKRSCSGRHIVSSEGGYWLCTLSSWSNDLITFALLGLATSGLEIDTFHTNIHLLRQNGSKENVCVGYSGVTGTV